VHDGPYEPKIKSGYAGVFVQANNIKIKSDAINNGASYSSEKQHSRFSSEIQQSAQQLTKSEAYIKEKDPIKATLGQK
jgi:hypothetical protein